MSELLQIKNLSVQYNGVTAVQDISFAITEGRVTALLGANGAGKTSILRAISGMIKSSGDILFCGSHISGDRPEKAARIGIAHVPEDRGTFKGLTVEENLSLGAISRRGAQSIRQDRDRVYAYFPRLAERARQQAGTMSGGEQQMLAIGRALMLRPKLVLLDEPSFGLAPSIVKEVFAILARLKRDEKLSMLLVEQNSNLALSLADHAHLMKLGAISMSGDAEAMRADENIRQAYLGH
ncbi:branched-chain amino acid transport system ATP-binding protein [Nitrobacteraceae bacterium AZCC 1564]